MGFIINPYRYSSVQVNTLIGGIGGTLSTPTLLAAKLSLSASDISNFSVDGDNNISCYIGVNYSINSNAFLSDTTITWYLDLDGYCTTVNGESFRNTTSLQFVIFPAATTSGNNAFLYSSSHDLFLWSAPIMNPLGTTVGSDNFFINSNFEYLYTDVTNQTNNGGGVEGDVAYIIPRTTNFRYSDNTTAPSEITDLASSGSYAGTIDLSWSAPTSSNSIEFYMVFLGAKYVGFTTSTSYIITGLTPSTNYEVKVIAIDIEGNNSGFSNIVNVTTAATYSVPTADLVSYWEIDSDSLDQVGANDGTDTSMSYVSGGIVSNCADFTAGTGSKINIADAESLTFGNGTTDSPFTYSYWMKWNGTPATTVFINKKNISTGEDAEYQLDFDGSNIQFFLFDNTASNQLKISQPYSFVAGVWYNIICTYDGSGSNTGMEIYVNGVLQSPARTTLGTYVAMEDEASPVTIGKNAQSTTRSLDGYMDEIGLFDVELTAVQASETYSKGLNGNALNA